MGKGRLEAFSDGVIAVIITIMVLEMKVPHGTDVAAVMPLIPVFLTCVLSFVFVGIYWNNHHHMLHAVQNVTGGELKGILSVVIYAVAILLAFWQPIAACALYVLVAIMWLCPDPRIERPVAK